jgi:hypothetical protein
VGWSMAVLFRVEWCPSSSAGKRRPGKGVRGCSDRTVV